MSVKLRDPVKFKKDDRVRMTVASKTALRANGSTDHVREFGRCIGVVAGLTDYGPAWRIRGDLRPSGRGIGVGGRARRRGPELDVVWQPSKLRYSYKPDMLEKVT